MTGQPYAPSHCNDLGIPSQMSRRDVQKEKCPFTIVLQRRAKACRQTRAGTPDARYLDLCIPLAKGHFRGETPRNARQRVRTRSGRGSRREQRARLVDFFGAEIDTELTKLTARRAQEIYQAVVAKPCNKTGAPPSAATHRFYLKLAQGFFSSFRKQ